MRSETEQNSLDPASLWWQRMRGLLDQRGFLFVGPVRLTAEVHTRASMIDKELMTGTIVVRVEYLR